MDEMIRSYIDELFSEGPKTRKAMDLKEEMAQNTIEILSVRAISRRMPTRGSLIPSGM